MRIALISNAPAPYRVPALAILASTDAIDLHVIYCAQGHIDKSEKGCDHGSSKVYYLNSRYYIFAKRFFHFDTGVISLLKKIDPDVVITTGYIPTYVLAIGFALVFGKSHVSMTDGTRKSEEKLSFLHRLIRRFVIKRSSAFIGVSNGGVELYESYGAPSGRIFKAPLAVFNDKFNINVARDYDLMYCGRFVEHKNPDFIISIGVALAERLGRKVRIQMIGDGPMIDLIRNLAKQYTSFLDIDFRGYLSQEDLPLVYATSKIFLLPSEWEPWGVVVNEACAAGTPAIVSNHVGAAGDLIVDGRNGFVSELILEKWVDICFELIQSESYWLKISNAAKSSVDKFSYQNASKEIMNACLIAKPRPTAKTVVVASLMREDGTTGVQTHIREYLKYLNLNGESYKNANPFFFHSVFIFLFVVVRKILEKINAEFAVRFYRWGHALVLRLRLYFLLMFAKRPVVYAQCPVSANVALSLAKGRVPVYMVIHFNISQADEWVAKGMIRKNSRTYLRIKELEKNVIPRCSGIISVSRFAINELHRSGILIENPFAVVPNFVEDVFPANGSRSNRLVCVGTLESRKNQKYLLDIVASSLRFGFDLHVDIVGAGPDEAFLKGVVNELGIGGNVQFLGAIKNARALMGDYAGLIHVANIENLPLCVIEALASGCPIFAVPVGGIPEMFDDHIEGRYLPADSSDEAASIIASVLRSKDQLDVMSAKARERFINNFSVDVVADRLHNFLVSNHE